MKLIVCAVIVVITFSGSDLYVPLNKGTLIGRYAKVNVIKDITKEEAVNKVRNMIGDIPKNYYLQFDNMVTVESVQYYVVHFYEEVIDDSEKHIGHTATHGWFYVNRTNGDVYILNILENKLEKYKKAA